MLEIECTSIEFIQKVGEWMNLRKMELRKLNLWEVWTMDELKEMRQQMNSKKAKIVDEFRQV